MPEIFIFQSLPMPTIKMVWKFQTMMFYLPNAPATFMKQLRSNPGFITYNIRLHGCSTSSSDVLDSSMKDAFWKLSRNFIFIKWKWVNVVFFTLEATENMIVAFLDLVVQAVPIRTPPPSLRSLRYSTVQCVSIYYPLQTHPQQVLHRFWTVRHKFKPLICCFLSILFFRKPVLFQNPHFLTLKWALENILKFSFWLNFTYQDIWKLILKGIFSDSNNIF